DPRKIRLLFDGADELRIDDHGDLVMKQGENEYRHRKPAAYQEIAGKRIPVEGRWTVQGKQASFRIASYDHRQTLVIDPVLLYSTYLGGNGIDYAYAIVYDSFGKSVVTGCNVSA